MRFLPTMVRYSVGPVVRCSGPIPLLTPDCPQAHLFEREIAEQWVVPEGHPWLPVRFHAPFDGRRDVWGRTREQIFRRL